MYDGPLSVISAPPSHPSSFHCGLNARTTKLPSPLSTKGSKIGWIRWSSAPRYGSWWYFVWPIYIAAIACHDKKHESTLSSAFSFPAPPPENITADRSLHDSTDRQSLCMLLLLRIRIQRRWPERSRKDSFMKRRRPLLLKISASSVLQIDILHQKDVNLCIANLEVPCDSLLWILCSVSAVPGA